MEALLFGLQRNTLGAKGCLTSALARNESEGFWTTWGRGSEVDSVSIELSMWLDPDNLLAHVTAEEQLAQSMTRHATRCAAETGSISDAWAELKTWFVSYADYLALYQLSNDWALWRIPHFHDPSGDRLAEGAIELIDGRWSAGRMRQRIVEHLSQETRRIDLICALAAHRILMRHTFESTNRLVSAPLFRAANAVGQISPVNLSISQTIGGMERSEDFTFEPSSAVNAGALLLAEGSIYSFANLENVTSERSTRDQETTTLSGIRVTGLNRQVQGVAQLIWDEEVPQHLAGAVLVGRTLPLSIVPHLGKIAGLVTEEGGLASHAAIVARARAIPCVVSVRGIIAAVNDGDHVTLCANSGDVVVVRRSDYVP
jgi:phosphohistidine swiveling domain-containing protein